MELAEYVRDLGYMPGAGAGLLSHALRRSPPSCTTPGLDPRTMEPVYVPTDPHEKAMQRALLQYQDPKNYRLALEALHAAHREDLIGTGPGCLLPAPGRKTRRPGQKAKNDTPRSGKASA